MSCWKFVPSQNGGRDGFLVRPAPLLSPSGTLLHIANIPVYVRKPINYYQNMELITIAKQKSYYFPTEHVLMPVIPRYLHNDNAKWSEIHRWQPDQRALKLASQAFIRMRTNIYRGARILTFDEAILRAEKNTSSGYLYKLMGFTTKGEVLVYYPELRYMVQQLVKGHSYLSIWEMAPKVEIRSLQKLIDEDESKRKQRTFMVADTLMYIVGLMLYSEQNDQLNALCDNKEEWCGVGISIFHGGWNNLAMNLLSVNPNVICCDESAMEACVTLALQEISYEARNSMLPTEYANLAHWYKMTVQHGLVHDGFGKIMQKVGGNSTGQLLTIYENIDASAIKKMYHLAKRCVTVDELITKCKKTGVKIIGDDDIIPYNPMWEGLIESSSELGFTTKVEHWNVPLCQAKFLNFGFRFHIPTSMYTFEPNYDKLFAGLFFYRKQNSWRLTLARLYAMKILCYTNRHRYEEVEYYITHILNEHTPEIIGETALDAVITSHSLFCQDKSRQEIESLIFSLESNVSEIQTLHSEITPFLALSC